MEKNMMSALLEQFTLHTRLFSNVLVEISPEHATKRMNDKTNHIAWLTGSMVSIRFKLANLLGMNEQEPFPHLFKDGKAIQNDITYPGINELAEDWEPISKKLLEKLGNLSEKELAETSPIKLPVNDESMLGALVFFADRESYVLGQIGILRRIFGYDAMKYN
ncbi:MAG: DinB family protein [Caldithrix sp.]|nr:MAG: DinB family protein [Caldithrix sp.]TDI83251.1 MAG: DinB family protein [Caldithrix sp.]